MLEIILADKNLAVVDLHKSLKAAGFAVNIKRLYRLIEPRPIRNIDLNVAGAICEELQIGIEDLIQFEKPEIELERLDLPLQYRLDELRSLNNQGRLDERDRVAFDELCKRAHANTLRNASILVEWKRSRENKAGRSRREAVTKKPLRKRASYV